MQTAYTRKVSNSPYALTHQSFTEAKRFESPSNLRTHIFITQRNIRLMIITHAPLQVSVQINTLLELFDQSPGLQLVDAIA
jgi:hypothetical protein